MAASLCRTGMMIVSSGVPSATSVDGVAPGILVGSKVAGRVTAKQIGKRLSPHLDELADCRRASSRVKPPVADCLIPARLVGHDQPRGRKTNVGDRSPALKAFSLE